MPRNPSGILINSDNVMENSDVIFYSSLASTNPDTHPPTHLETYITKYNNVYSSEHPPQSCFPFILF